MEARGLRHIVDRGHDFVIGVTFVLMFGEEFEHVCDGHARLIRRVQVQCHFDGTETVCDGGVVDGEVTIGAGGVRGPILRQAWFEDVVKRVLTRLHARLATHVVLGVDGVVLFEGVRAIATAMILRGNDGRAGQEQRTLQKRHLECNENSTNLKKMMNLIRL